MRPQWSKPTCTGLEQGAVAVRSATMADNRVQVGGHYFEDLTRGQVFADAPGLTLTPGHAVLHQALSGDRLRLPLDHELSAAVTGRTQPFAPPRLVCPVAIGETTSPSPRGRGD